MSYPGSITYFSLRTYGESVDEVFYLEKKRVKTMKIAASTLERFVKKVSLGGTILSINLDFKEDGLYSCVKSSDDVVLTNVFLSEKAFVNYKALGEIFIKDTNTFIKYLKTFGSIVELVVSDKYMLKIFDSAREAYVMLGAEIVCENVWRKKLPTVPTTERVLLSKDQLARTVADVSLLKINQVCIKKSEAKLLFEVGQLDESDFFVNSVEAKEQTNGVASVKVGASFATLFTALDGDVEFKLGVDVPLIVTEEKDHMKFICYIAPMVESK